jgi:hypothetical protein
VQIRASSDSGGKALLQFSQVGRNSSIVTSQYKLSQPDRSVSSPASKKYFIEDQDPPETTLTSEPIDPP